MTEGERALVAAGLLMAFVGYLLIRKTRKTSWKFLFITLMTLRLAAWIFALGLLAIVLGVLSARQP
jgi:hypothetical protein